MCSSGNIAYETESIFLNYAVYYDIFSRLISESDLCLPNHCRSRGSLLHLITITYTHILSRTSLDERSALRRDLYLTTNNTHNRQRSMPPEGFEPANPASERQQTYALDRAATGIGSFLLSSRIEIFCSL